MSSLKFVLKILNPCTFVLVVAIVLSMVPSVHALEVGGPGGTWPKSWPKELESLRKQASTWVGGQVMNTRYEIPFVNRERFEAAWPHIIGLKSKGSSLTLMNGRRNFHNSSRTASVMILPPLENSSGNLSQTRIVLIVDGYIIDLNRIRLPADSPIDGFRLPASLALTKPDR